MRDQSGHSPTRTATRTEANTRGNYTVTGGAGSGDTTVNFRMPGDSMAGADWKSIFQSIPAAATAQALRLALTPIAGSSPTVENHGDYYSLSFSPEQEERLAAWILSQLNKEPGPVRVQTGGIALRVVSRQYWPYALGLVALGGVAVYLATKKKGRK